MRPISVLFRTSFRRFFNNKGATIVTFLVPVVLIYLFGHVFGLHQSGRKGGGGPSGIRIAIVNQHGGPASQRLIDALKGEKAFNILTETTAKDGTKSVITEDQARAAIRDNNYRYALVIPADLLPKDSIGVRVKFLWDPRNDIEAQTVNGLLQKAIFTRAPRLLMDSLQQHAIELIGAPAYETFSRGIASTVAKNFDVSEDQIFRDMTESANPDQTEAARSTQSDTTTSGENFMASLFKIETEQLAGQEVKNPMASRMVGGYAVMFLLFALSGSASAVFDDKKAGIFLRILSAPVRPSHILWSRFLFGIVLGVFQLIFLFVAGEFFFGLDLMSHLPALLAVSIATAAACTAFGMLIAAICPSAEAVSGLTTLIVLPMTAIGGAWFPVSFMPEFIQKLSKLSIVYWSVEGYANVLWAGKSAAGVLPHIGILLGAALVVMLTATYFFKRGKMFE